MQSYPLKPHYTAQFSAVSFSFHWFPSFYYFHVLSFLQALVCGFQHNSHPFSDCFLCFTHVMGTLVQFTLLLCYICFYMFLGGVGTNSLPGFHRGKIAPGGGRGSRGPPVVCCPSSRCYPRPTIYATTPVAIPMRDWEIKGSHPTFTTLPKLKHERRKMTPCSTCISCPPTSLCVPSSASPH